MPLAGDGYGPMLGAPDVRQSFVRVFGLGTFEVVKGDLKQPTLEGFST